MWSERFNKNVWLTDHARQAMTKREIAESLVYDMVETDNIEHKDDLNAWIFKHYPERNDNLLCIATLIEQAVIVKTVMTDWRLLEDMQ
ncbi:MAG: DUF4258 domain-containing protein [Candidatus Competibacteraceae bacterium]